MDKQQLLRRIIGALLAFFFACGLFGMLVITLVRSTLLNASYLSHCYGTGDIYDRMVAEIQTEYTDLGIPGGIPEEVFAKVLDKQQIVKTVNDMIESEYRNEPYTVDTAVVRNTLYTAFVEYMETENIYITDELEESLTYLADLCAQKYAAGVSNTFVRHFIRLMLSYDTSLTTAWIICLLFTVGCGTLMIRTRSRLSSVLRYGGLSLAGTGWMLTIVPAIILLSGRLARLAIAPLSLKYLISAYVSHVCYFAIGAGVVLLIGAGTLLWLADQKKADNPHHNEDGNEDDNIQTTGTDRQSVIRAIFNHR